MYRDKGRRPAKEYGSFRAMVWAVGSTPPPTSGYPGAFGVIKPSRPVTVCAAESSAYPTHAVPQKRHISGTFELDQRHHRWDRQQLGAVVRSKYGCFMWCFLCNLDSYLSRYTWHTISMETPYLTPPHSYQRCQLPHIPEA